MLVTKLLIHKLDIVKLNRPLIEMFKEGVLRFNSKLPGVGSK